MGKSFYGGIDGRPFILKKIYQTIPEMIDRNKYKTDLNYGEYALISNENRNHPDNGKLFKRVYASTGENIEAFIYNNNQFEKTTYKNVEMKYIGAIVGPQGSALEFKLFDKNKGLDELKNSYEDSKFIETDSELILSPPDPNNEDENKKELFPGKPGSVVTLKAYSFRDKNGNKSTVYLDMSIPYNVIKWTTTQLSSQEKVSILESEIHPFYQSYNLGIPKGQDGTSFNNIRVITPTAADNVVTISFDGNRNITATTYEGLQDDIDKKRAIWVADVTDYKVNDEGTKYLVYLGDYNIINGASIVNGHLDITTGHKENEIHEQLHWPINININPEDGAVTYTDVEVNEDGNNKTYSQDSLTWVKDLTIGNTGLLNTFTTTGENQIKDQQLHWIKNISINPDTGEVTYTDISGSTTNQEQNLKWLKNVSLSQDGTFTKTNNQNESVNQTQKLKWVNGVSLSQDGTFIQSYNNGETTPQQNKRLKWLENIQIADNGVVTKVYNHGDNDANTKLKWPINIQLNSEDGTVATTYNDGSVNTIQNPRMDWIKSATLNDDKLLQIDYVNADDISVNLKTPNQIELTESGDFYATYNTGDRILLGNIGELNSISTTAIAEGEKEPANLMAGGLLFITQDAIMEG